VDGLQMAEPTGAVPPALAGPRNARRSRAAWLTARGADAMLSIRRILFPTDFSEPAAYAWSYTLTFAEKFSAGIHLLHVVEPLPQMTEPFMMKYHPEKRVESLAMQAAAAMDRQVEEAKTCGLIFHHEVRVGTASCEIARYAANQDINLIVMATHGRTGMAHALVGSVAEKVVRMAPCPVLTIRHPAFRVQKSTGSLRADHQLTTEERNEPLYTIRTPERASIARQATLAG
jgi:universal stress protein A